MVFGLLTLTLCGLEVLGSGSVRPPVTGLPLPPSRRRRGLRKTVLLAPEVNDSHSGCTAV